MAKTYKDLLTEVKKEINEVSVDVALERYQSDTPPLFLDVREPQEWDGGHVPGATHIARGVLETKIANNLPDRSQPILVYCAGGVRSAFAAQTMQALGYTDVTSMLGGFGAWRELQAPIEVPVTKSSTSPALSERYSRHHLLPEVGEQGQQKLLDAKVLLVGAGGLGSPAALYLAAAGIGTLGICDGDVVDESNLQRQVVHRTYDIGRPKVDSAREAIKALNPDVTVHTYNERLTPENAEAIVGQYDVVVDGADNFPTRYLVNDVTYLLGKANAHGSIFRFEGQATTFVPGEGPCYRCLYPEAPPPELAPS
jgi:molybdopterin/thiamine biosynthesis adenylyltransferase/rhodanese-related sulfurtransferase